LEKLAERVGVCVNTLRNWGREGKLTRFVSRTAIAATIRPLYLPQLAMASPHRPVSPSSMPVFPVTIRRLSVKASSLLDRSGTLKAGSTTSERRYLRIVFRDKPVRREISSIDSRSRNAQRQITLNNSMLIGPMPPAENSRGEVKTWINSQWKFATRHCAPHPVVNRCGVPTPIGTTSN
jgi:hypothetical protein